MKIDQSLYGYDKGHTLLAGSNLPSSTAPVEVLRNHPVYLSERFSDLSGYLPHGLAWDHYYSGWWVTKEIYALTSTVADIRPGQRLGCVLTHAIFVPSTQIAQAPLECLVPLLCTDLATLADKNRFKSMLDLPPLGEQKGEEIWRGNYPDSFVASDDRSAALTMAADAWRFEQARGFYVPAFCTMSLAPRKLGSPSMQFFPRLARSAFRGLV